MSRGYRVKNGLEVPKLLVEFRIANSVVLESVKQTAISEQLLDAVLEGALLTRKLRKPKLLTKLGLA